MGVILDVLLRAVLVGFAAAVPVLVYRGSTLSLLARRGARPGAYLLTAIPPALSVLATLGWVIAFGLGFGIDLRFLFLATVVGTTSESLVPRAITVTGGPQGDRTQGENQLLAHLDAAERHRRQKDESGWRSELRQAAGVWVPTAADIQAAIQGLLNFSPTGHRRDFRRHIQALGRAVDRRWAPPAILRRGATVALIAAFLVPSVATVALGVEARRACFDAEALVVGVPGIASPAPLLVAVVSDPEPGAQLIFERALDLNLAADSRHDPETHEQLEDAGFVEGFQRIWRAADGREIHASTFAFRESSGALEYQRTVTRYACQFAKSCVQRGGGRRRPPGSPGVR